MSSFNFSWNSDNKPIGKAFAKKRKDSEALKVPDKLGKRSVLNNNNNKVKKKSPFGQEEGVRKKWINKSSNEKLFDESSHLNKLVNKKHIKPKDLKDTSKESQFIPKRQENPYDFSTKLIKRKRKKDKAAAQEENTNATTQNLNSMSTQNQTHALFSVGHKDIYVNTNIKGKPIVEKMFSHEKKFKDLNIHKHLVSNLEKIDFTTLTNVQEKSIPVILTGKNVLIRSQTGSGKTLVYAVTIIDTLQCINPRLQRSDGVQAIIVVPTRELALQTHELFGKINTFQWIVVGRLCGGENRNTEKSRLRKGVHVLIATPGRLLDHMLHTSSFKTSNVRCLVLDEADRLLDMGFKKDIVKIVEELSISKTNLDYDPIALLKGERKNLELKEETDPQENIPLGNPSCKTLQTILLSATLTKGIADLADFAMKDHIYVDALDESFSVNPDHMVIPNTVKQKFIITHVKHRLFTLSAMLVAKARKASKVFVFMATSQMVDYHHELFTKCLVKMPKNRGKLKTGNVVLLEAVDSDDEEEIVLDLEFFKLHGSMDQPARKEVFTKFRAAKKGVLLCTDVAARGIDVPTADCIIQYTGPQSDEDYLHRVGRTGRAGKSGSSYIFLTHEEQDFITRLQGHKVFLQKHDPEDFLKHLSVLMEEPDHEKAATALQKHYENALSNNKDLHRMGCLAYTSWSRFYNTYSTKMRSIFDFKKINLGHYVTSFGLRETPTEVAKIVHGQVSKNEQQKFNKKLSIHNDDQTQRSVRKRKIKSVSLTTSEYSSGLKPSKKKKKRNDD